MQLGVVLCTLPPYRNLFSKKRRNPLDENGRQVRCISGDGRMLRTFGLFSFQRVLSSLPLLELSESGLNCQSQTPFSNSHLTYSTTNRTVSIWHE